MNKKDFDRRRPPTKQKFDKKTRTLKIIFNSAPSKEEDFLDSLSKKQNILILDLSENELQFFPLRQDNLSSFCPSLLKIILPLNCGYSNELDTFYWVDFGALDKDKKQLPPNPIIFIGSIDNEEQIISDFGNLSHSFRYFLNDRNTGLGFIYGTISSYEKRNHSLPSAHLSLEDVISIMTLLDPSMNMNLGSYFDTSKSTVTLKYIATKKDFIKDNFINNQGILEAIFIILGTYAKKHSIFIRTIDLSSIDTLYNVSFIDSVSKTFPYVKTINLIDTQANLKVLSTESLKRYTILSNEIEDTEPPPYIDHQQSLTLSMFTPVVIKANTFPTNKFIAELFEKLWSDIQHIDSFYSFGAGFSFSVDHSTDPYLSLYEQFTSNYITEQSSYVVGSSEVRALQAYIFPRGFFAYPLEITNQELFSGLYMVIVHGVFQGVNNRVFAFHRTFIISECKRGFEIFNDQLFITHAKLK